MRMLLTSGGIDDDAIRDALLEMLDAAPARSRMVVVIDAILPFPGDKSRLLEHLEQFRSLGWAEFDVISLLATPPAVAEARLRSADVVFCYGGSNHWLSHAWTATGLAPLLRELLDEKVYLGLSAGSMIFSRLHAAAVDAMDDHDEVEMLQLESVAAAVPLFDWFVVPHLGEPYFPEQSDEWAADVAARLGGPSWFIDDASALLVREPEAAPAVVGAGHWLRFDSAGVLADSR
jgi:dipeptidase E